MKNEKPASKTVATHREALKDYFILETIEAGIVLVGCEVKSLREGDANLAGSFARFERDELYLYNLYIAPYAMGNRQNPEPRRERKLLLRRPQILKWQAKVQEKGLTIVPTKLYFNDRGIAKVELGIAKAKKAHDKREDIKKASAKREMDRAIKNRNRG